MLRVFTFAILALALIYAIEGVSMPFAKTDMSYNSRCQPLRCSKQCQYGHQKKDGCDICKCHDPCNPPGRGMVCGANKKCHVKETPTGKFVAQCSPISSRETKGVCQQRLAAGTCRANLKRFYYNTKTNRCEQFYFTGCGGNANNFPNLSECRRICVKSSY